MSDSIVRFLEGKLGAYLDDLRTLVSIDSGSTYQAGVNAVNDWLEARLRKLGFAVERQPHARLGDSLLASLQGQSRGRILLMGHTDTVFPIGTATERPMSIQGDKILGPGTCDMKAGLLSGLYAVEALQAAGFDDFELLNFLAVPDEESGERHAIPLIRAESRQADVVLNLEAARESGHIVIGRKGLRWYTVEAFGHAAHAGVEPEKGQNAILALAHHVVALDRLNGLRPGATLNVGTFEGGTWPSVVAEYARMRLDLRAFTQADLQTLDEAMRAQLATTTVPQVRIAVTLEEDSVCPPMEYTPAVAELERLAQEIAHELGFEIGGAITGGASDASYAAAEGTPVLDGLGPVGGLDHTPDEYIQLSSIVPRTALLARLILAISQGQKEQR